MEFGNQVLLVWELFADGAVPRLWVAVPILRMLFFIIWALFEFSTSIWLFWSLFIFILHIPNQLRYRISKAIGPWLRTLDRALNPPPLETWGHQFLMYACVWHTGYLWICSTAASNQIDLRFLRNYQFFLMLLLLNLWICIYFLSTHLLSVILLICILEWTNSIRIIIINLFTFIFIFWYFLEFRWSIGLEKFCVICVLIIRVIVCFLHVVETAIFIYWASFGLIEDQDFF